MFVDYRNWRPPEPAEPQPSRPRLTRTQEKRLIWAIGLNLLMLFLGPLAGVTMFDVFVALVSGG